MTTESHDFCSKECTYSSTSLLSADSKHVCVYVKDLEAFYNDLPTFPNVVSFCLHTFPQELNLKTFVSYLDIIGSNELSRQFTHLEFCKSGFNQTEVYSDADLLSLADKIIRICDLCQDLKKLELFTIFLGNKGVIALCDYLAQRKRSLLQSLNLSQVGITSLDAWKSVANLLKHSKTLLRVYLDFNNARDPKEWGGIQQLLIEALKTNQKIHTLHMHDVFWPHDCIDAHQRLFRHNLSLQYLVVESGGWSSFYDGRSSLQARNHFFSKQNLSPFMFIDIFPLLPLELPFYVYLDIFNSWAE